MNLYNFYLNIEGLSESWNLQCFRKMYVNLTVSVYPREKCYIFPTIHRSTLPLSLFSPNPRDFSFSRDQVWGDFGKTLWNSLDRRLTLWSSLRFREGSLEILWISAQFLGFPAIPRDSLDLSRFLLSLGVSGPLDSLRIFASRFLVLDLSRFLLPSTGTVLDLFEDIRTAEN